MKNKINEIIAIYGISYSMIYLFIQPTFNSTRVLRNIVLIQVDLTYVEQKDIGFKRDMYDIGEPELNTVI